VQRDLLFSELQSAHDLMRLPIEKPADGTAAGTLHTLVTEIDVLSQLFHDTAGQFAVDAKKWPGRWLFRFHKSLEQWLTADG